MSRFRSAFAPSAALVLAAASVSAQAPATPKPPLALEGRVAGEERDDNGLKMKFYWWPPGTFRMGSQPDEPGHGENEGPVQVTLSRGFWMEKHEVTQAQWQQVMRTSIGEQKVKAKGPW